MSRALALPRPRYLTVPHPVKREPLNLGIAKVKTFAQEMFLPCSKAASLAAVTTMATCIFLGVAWHDVLRGYELLPCIIFFFHT
jgi:hypothetical protein